MHIPPKYTLEVKNGTDEGENKPHDLGTTDADNPSQLKAACKFFSIS